MTYASAYPILLVLAMVAYSTPTPAAPATTTYGYYSERVVYESSSTVTMMQSANITWLTSPSFGYDSLLINNQLQGQLLWPSWKHILSLTKQKSALPDEIEDDSLAHLRPSLEDIKMYNINTNTAGSLTHPINALWPLMGIFHPQRHHRYHDDGHDHTYITSLKEWPATVLVIGLGCGSGGISLVHHYPKWIIDVVELDPVVVQLTFDHYPLFKWLTTPRSTLKYPMNQGERRERVRVIIEDGVHYLSSTNNTYDIIVIYELLDWIYHHHFIHYHL
jgi:hypothetical protein